jgi:hypothetical protein
VVAAYLAKQANEQLGLDPTAFDSILSTQFVIDDLRFASADDGTRLAVAQAPLRGWSEHDGQPALRRGQVWHYSADVPGDLLILFIVHIPLLDRAERTRKEFLIGGSAPPWYGPA